MESKKESFRIVHRNGVATYFHVVDSDMSPIANFDIAYRWYKEGSLTIKSELEIFQLMNNPDIKEKYEKFLENKNFRLHSR